MPPGDNISAEAAKNSNTWSAVNTIASSAAMLEEEKIPLRINLRASLVPAAAVIPAHEAFTTLVAFKGLVV